VQFRILGGAAARVPADATAYGWRDRSLLLWIIADSGSSDRDGLEPYERWVADFRAALEDHAVGHFVGFMGDDAPAATAYPPSTWARLRRIKARYDPDNMFGRNHNVPPASGARTRERSRR
jgi:FAD/FMN-containing dehydrogenase